MTKPMSELLEYLRAESGAGRKPSFDDMRIAMRVRSKSSIARLICALEERGHIRRLAHRARAIEVVEPEGLASVTIGLDGRALIRTSPELTRDDRAVISIALQHLASEMWPRPIGSAT